MVRMAHPTTAALRWPGRAAYDNASPLVAVLKYRGFPALILTSPRPRPPYDARNSKRPKRGRDANMAEPTDKINLSNPTEVARETLRRLAMRRISPTPDNYQTLYEEIVSVPAAPANKASTHTAP